MPITLNFKKTVQARALCDPEFREKIRKESIECILSSDIETGEALSQDLRSSFFSHKSFDHPPRKGRIVLPAMALVTCRPGRSDSAFNRRERRGAIIETDGESFLVKDRRTHPASPNIDHVWLRRVIRCNLPRRRIKVMASLVFFEARRHAFYP